MGTRFTVFGRANTCDLALKLLNDEITSDIQNINKTYGRNTKMHSGITGTTRTFFGRPYTVYPIEYLQTTLNTSITFNNKTETTPKLLPIVSPTNHQHCQTRNTHCLYLQETHRGERKARPRIPEMTLVAERPHAKYGSAIFIRDDLMVKSISITAANHVEVTTAQLPDVVVHSVYKPPSVQFILPPLAHRSLPQIVIGDFNSHNTI